MQTPNLLFLLKGIVLKKKIKKTTIGGQALIEGILMRGPEVTATAIRKPDGEILVTTERNNTISEKSPFFRLPFIRGVVSLVDSLKLGMGALNYSASFYEDESESSKAKEGIMKKIFKDKSEKIETVLTMVLSIIIALGLFLALPTGITNLFREKISSTVALNFIEGILRIIVFLIYVIAISRFEDIHRVFEYHGAEHKSIACYEHQDELTVENVRKYSILHPRCGTSFMFMVMIISIIVLSFFGWPNPILRMITRILMLPVIAGISYEINKWIGRSSGTLACILAYPGLFLQKIATVKEPDDDQIEVAIAALKEVIPPKEGMDAW